MCLNANRALLGVPPTYEAPSYIHGSSYIAFDDIWLTPSRFMISGLRDPENENARLVVRIASTASNGVTKLWGQTVVLGKFHESDWGDVQLTEAYLDQFGVPIVVGQKYFIELYWMDEYSGYVSEISRVCYPAVDDLSIHGQTFHERRAIRIEDISEGSDATPSSCLFELAPGSKIVAADITLVGKGESITGSIHCPITQEAQDRIGYVTTILPGRSNSENSWKYCISYNEIHVSYKNFGISNRGGSLSQSAEVFGTSFSVPNFFAI